MAPHVPAAFPTPLAQCFCQCSAWRATSSMTALSRRRCYATKAPRLERRRTLPQRKMWAWLRGAGAVFRDPLPGSTNYLSAYDRHGNLVRLLKAGASRLGGAQNPDVVAADEASKAEQSRDADPDGAPPRRAQPNDSQDSRDGGGEPLGTQAKGVHIPAQTDADLQPFPANRHFRSEAVLSDEIRENIYRRIVEAGESVRRVSADLSVEMGRVAAVVRLKTIEKQWIKKGQRLATPYAQAVAAMLPQTPLKKPRVKHESINDLPVHQATFPQIFEPVAESRHFTRADAAAIFQDDLLTADERVPHPQLIAAEGVRATGTSATEAYAQAWKQIEAADAHTQARALARAEARERDTITKKSGRWEFKIVNVVVDQGTVGKHVEGIGARYGLPPQDRKKGQVKIPTRVV